MLLHSEVLMFPSIRNAAFVLGISALAFGFGALNAHADELQQPPIVAAASELASIQASELTFPDLNSVGVVVKGNASDQAVLPMLVFSGELSSGLGLREIAWSDVTAPALKMATENTVSTADFLDAFKQNSIDPGIGPSSGTSGTAQ